jgi:ring-1,2-phenylacetyl-CoA epoxidase subunit PaaB
MNSLDPRVARLPQIGEEGKINPKAPLDQFGTYEIFVQPKEGKPFQHEGIVHAPNLEMAYILGKETFTRRFTCTSLYVVDTRDVLVSTLTEGDINVYDKITTPNLLGDEKKKYEIYHLPKRGKQHIHAGSVMASSAEEALYEAKQKFNQGKIIYNVWAIASDKIRFTSVEEQELWITLPEKKFRDAAEYKGGDKLKDFLEKSNFTKNN